MNNTSNMNNILAIGAHFDDVELAIGGTLNKLSKNNKVYKLTLTDNVTLSKSLKLDVKYKTSKINAMIFKSSDPALESMCPDLTQTQRKNWIL